MHTKHTKLNPDYTNHIIFTELDQYINYYGSLSFSILKWLNVGVKSLNFETYLISSIKSTVESIKILLQHGTINDAYALTRKYHDSIIIHMYTLLYLEDNSTIEKIIVEKINDWLSGKEKIPDYKSMHSYLQNHTKLQKINKLLFYDKYYSSLRQKFNDHTHYNYFQHMMLNDYNLFNPNRIKILDQMSLELKAIFIEHFIWLFTVKDHYMMSDDHLDYLEFGEIPPKDSQYWVAVFVQSIFDNIVKPNRNDLANELISSTSMQLN